MRANSVLKWTKRRAICPNSVFFLMVSTIWSKCPKIILWVSKSIFRLRLALWDKFGGYRKHSEVDFEAGKWTFRSSKKMKFFQNFWDSQIFLGFYRFAWLSIWSLTVTPRHPKSMLWVSKSVSRLRWTHRGDFGGYRKQSEVNFDAGKCTFRWSKKNEIFSKFLRFPKFPWILQICMASTFEAYDEF